MKVKCPHCSRSLEFAGPPPSFCGYCGKALPQSALDETKDYQPAETPFGDMSKVEIPERIGGYKVIRPLGGGGMGVVFEAESADGRRVALKLMRSEAELSSTAEERFRQEGRLASGIVHPRCVFVFDTGMEADRPYIAMELMSGETLKDLVERAGPMEPLDAVAKILDVVDGLREAHALGVIHRDVKPSNCFLESDGRVKIGDFGLSRSLAAPSHLTQTGGFLGTVLFAAPEQHKAEAVDIRTDVYSVCATLFYLSTGRAPFEDARGAAAVVARVVSEPAPSLRKLRPGIPAALEKIVLRGLERSPERRFQSLDELRTELSLLLPERLSFAGVVTRAAAYLFDAVLVQVTLLFLTLLIGSLPGVLMTQTFEHVSVVARAMAFTAYFWFLESKWGASLGKRLVRLRVSSDVGLHAPSWSAVLVRSLVFCVLFDGLPDVVTTFLTPMVSANANTALYFAILLAGFLLLLSTMRSRNGYRMLHDVLSGTKVVQLPWPQSRPNLQATRIEARKLLPAPKDAPATLGRFSICGSLRKSDEGEWLLGEDSEIDRRAILWLRRTPSLSQERQRLVRAGRLRWLEGGTQGDLNWDAFLAPRGSPLAEVVKESGKLDWAATRILLEQLAEEFQSATEDETFPNRLTTDAVWLQTNGNVQLVDWSLETSGDARTVSGSSQASGLDLLRDVAVLALEGRTRDHSVANEPIRAVIPLHARSMVNRLLGAKEPAFGPLLAGKPPCDSTASFREDLAETKNLPVKVGLSLRALQISLMAIGLCFLLTVMLVATRTRTYYHLTRLQRIDDEQVWLRVFGENGIGRSALSALPEDHPLRKNPKRLDEIVDRRSQADHRRRATMTGDQLPLGKSLVHLLQLLEDDTDSKPTAFGDQVLHSPTAKDPTLYVFVPNRSGELGHYAFEVEQDDIRWIKWSDGPYGEDPDDETGSTVRFAIVLWVIWLTWGVVLRGGVSYRLAGIALVRSSGRKASRFQVLWRAIVFWTPLILTIVGAFWFDANVLNRPWTCEILNWSTLLLVVAYAAAVVISPAGTWHDRLSGVYLVPR